MAAFLEDMQIEWHSSFAQGRSKEKSVLDFHAGVFPGVPDKTRRRIFFNLQIVGELPAQFIGRFLAEQVLLRTLMGELAHHGNDRITQNGQIGTAALTLYWIFRLGPPGIKVCYEC